MSNIVSNEDLAWIPTLVILLVTIFSLFTFEIITKKYIFLMKISYWFLIFAPFIIIVLLLLILIFTKTDIFIILLVAGIIFVIMASFSFVLIRKKLLKKQQEAKKLNNKYHPKSQKWK